MIDFACSACGKRLSVSEDKAGKVGKCPSCGEPTRVPELKVIMAKPGRPITTSGPIGSDRTSSHRWKIALVAVAVIGLVAGLFWAFVLGGIGGQGIAKGGAWLTKKAGNSEPLRGLEITVLKPTVEDENEEYLALLKARLERTQSRLKQKQAARASARYDFESEDAQEAINGCNSDIVAITAEIDRASKLPPSAAVDMARLYITTNEETELNDDALKVWERVCAEHCVAVVHTDVDGKYQVDLPRGKYYFSAFFGSSNSMVKWLLPVEVGRGELAVDFHNENALKILNF
jgi:uncharacterized small protein (DUF1192 family)